LDVTPAGSASSIDDSSIATLRTERLKAIGQTHQAERSALAPIADGELVHQPIPLDKIAQIQVEPANIDFNAWNDSAQIVVMAKLTTGETVDATSQATFAADNDSVWLSQRGWVQSIRAGDAKIQVALGNHQQSGFTRRSQQVLMSILSATLIQLCPG
jgi:hypothetical protein